MSIPEGTASIPREDLEGYRKVVCDTGHGGAVIPDGGGVASSSGFSATWKGDTLVVRCPTGPSPEW